MHQNIPFPFRLNPRGRTDMVSDEQHVNGMLEMLVMTSAGERVNRPDFGGGLGQPLFGPASPELAATVKHTLRSEILQWLDDVIDLQDLEVWPDESQIAVNISYTLRRDGTTKTASFTHTI